MTTIETHAPRLPDENTVYEVKFTTHGTRGDKHCGSIYFEKESRGFKEVDCNLHGTRDREEYLPSAAKRLIREEGESVVWDWDGEVVAELIVGELYDGGSDE